MYTYIYKKYVHKKMEEVNSGNNSEDIHSMVEEVEGCFYFQELRSNVSCSDCNIGQRLHSRFKLDLLKSFRRRTMPTEANWDGKYIFYHWSFYLLYVSDSLCFSSAPFLFPFPL